MSTAVANDTPVKDVKKSQQKIRKRNKKKSNKQRQEEEAKRKAVNFNIFSLSRFKCTDIIYIIGVRTTATTKRG
jgi:hypothetical protein